MKNLSLSLSKADKLEKREKKNNNIKIQLEKIKEHRYLNFSHTILKIHISIKTTRTLHNLKIQAFFSPAVIKYWLERYLLLTGTGGTRQKKEKKISQEKAMILIK